MRKTAAVTAALVMAFAGIAAMPSGATALNVGPWQHNLSTGHYYRQVDNITWAQAETYAVTVGGHLVTVNDQAEQDWLAAIFTDPNLWIGMNDRAVEGSWVWSSGEPVTYTNWTEFEPNNCTFCGPPDGNGPLPQGEDAAVMNWTDPWDNVGWNDLADFGPASAIVEVTRLPKGPVGGMVSGSYRYQTSPGSVRQVSVTARGTDPVSGRWSFANVGAKASVAGDVTCLIVDGDEAWVAGRITSMNNHVDPELIGEGAFLWVRDGMAAGVPDRAFTWIADPGQSLADMEALCWARDTSIMGDLGAPDGFTVDRGAVTVRPG